jgi:hypothetical protein
MKTQKINLKNLNFRKEVVGKYLFWFNKEFIGVIDTIPDVRKYGSSKDDRYLIQITENSESAFIRTIEGSYKSEVFLTNKLNPKNGDVIFYNDMIIDTGCTSSDLLNTDYWDFDNLCFTEYPPGYLLKSIYKKPQILEWNDNKDACLNIPITGANSSFTSNKIYLLFL